MPIHFWIVELDQVLNRHGVHKDLVVGLSGVKLALLQVCKSPEELHQRTSLTLHLQQ